MVLIVDQSTVLRKIIAYLERYNKNSVKYPDPNNPNARDPEFIKKFEKGYCSGIASLWLYTKWLQTQPQQDAAKDRDDYEWFQKVVNLLAAWDEKSDLKPEEEKDVERFISHIEHFQNIGSYQPIGHGELQHSLEDTEKRKLTKEYSIAALFTLNQLKKLLETETIIQEGRLTLIDSHNHAVALFKSGGFYYFFNANSSTGEVKVSSIDEVATLIFSSYAAFKPENPSPIALRIFGFDAPPIPYKDVDAVLSAVKIESDKPSDNYAGGFTGLHMAARSGSLESIRYLIDKCSADINAKEKNGFTALMLAVNGGHIEIVKELLKEDGVALNTKEKDGWTALMLAAYYGHTDIVIELLKKDSIVLNAKDEDGWTALIFAVNGGHIEIVKELLKLGKKIDINAKNHNGETALIIAAKEGKPEVVLALLQFHKINVNEVDNSGNTVLGIIEGKIGACAPEQRKIYEEIYELVKQNLEAVNAASATERMHSLVSSASGKDNNGISGRVLSWQVKNSREKDRENAANVGLTDSRLNP